MTQATDTVKLIKVTPADGVYHDYETPDGRFQVSRPESGRMTDGWSFTDTARWEWHYDNRGRVVVKNVSSYSPYGTLSEVKTIIAGRQSDGYGLRSHEWMTAADARAAGEAAHAAIIAAIGPALRSRVSGGTSEPPASPEKALRRRWPRRMVGAGTQGGTICIGSSASR